MKMENKLCRKCDTIKPLDDFGIRSKNHPYTRAYCKECRYEQRKQWGVNNPEKVRSNDRKKYWKDPEKSRKLRKQSAERAKERDPEGVKLKKRKYYLDNKEQLSAKGKKYRKENPQVHKKAIAKYSAKNPHISRAKVIRRRANRIKATLGGNDEWKELELKLHKECVVREQLEGIRYSVDHIIPLVGKASFEGKYQQVVCGLHVPWNLQILPFLDNARKNSKFDGTYDNESWREDYLTSQTN